MKHALSLLLLIGAMFGLLGEQTAAAASAPVVAAAPAMSADCMEMMGEHPAKPDKQPCEGLTLDCIFAMGCAVPLMRDLAAPVAQAQVVVPQRFWITTTVLSGTDLIPEQHPPTVLG